MEPLCHESRRKRRIDSSLSPERLVMRSTKQSVRSLAIVAALGVVVTLASPAIAVSQHSPAAGSPVGDWRTSTLGVQQTVTFTKDGRIFGDSGCNRFSGGYTVKGSQIFIGPLAGTLMACPDPQLAAEAKFLRSLQTATNFRETQKALRLSTPTDVLVLRPTQ